jgi:hypothetical protein
MSSIEKFLMPVESIQYKASNVSMGGAEYDLYVTNKRIILFKEKGFVFKKPELISYNMKDIQNIVYREEGLVLKKGILWIELPRGRVEIFGKPDVIRGAYQACMQFWGA